MNRPDRIPGPSFGVAAASAADGEGGYRHADAALVFGRFVLYPARKLLAADACPVHLGSRAFELLVALVAKAGQVVGHDELVATVWPTTVVEENSLRVHISALRRALGESPAERYIITVPGHGYSFVMPVAPQCAPALALAHQVGWPALAPAPAMLARMTRVLGREQATAELARQLATHRLVTLVGAGGIGKSTVARALAAERGGAWRHGAVLVDLSGLSDPALAPATVAAAMGISVRADDAMASICGALHDTDMLLILDNCEHLIHAAALLAERILDATARVHILATSREPLYASGECIHRLPPLAMPADGEPLTVEQAFGYPAIALFVERAMANTDRFALTSANLPLIVHLCRQLDGLPLALELAAARVDSLGVEGLAARLDDLFALLTRGRRTALPRHAALQALLDCSYRLLSEAERTVLRRLSVFRANFSLESASMVCACAHIGASQVMEAVLTLAAKSLLSVDVVEGVARYRSLNTARRYAAARLAQSDDAGPVAERHARHLLALFARATADLDTHPLARWNAQYGGATGDLMGALDWAFGEDGNALLGVELAALVPFPMIELGMVEEYRRRVELALERLAALAPPPPMLELRLVSAWAICTAQVNVKRSEREAMCARLDRITPGRNGPESELLALSSMASCAFVAGDYPRVSALAERIALHARVYGERGDAIDELFRLLADRWHALGAHYLGRHEEARMLARRVLEAPLPKGSAPVLGHVPQTVSMGIVLSRIEWLTGFSDRALATARHSVALCDGEHPFALCQALAMGLAPIAIWRGDGELARGAVAQLQRHANRHAIKFWAQWANSLARVLGMPGLPDETPGGPRHYVSDNALALDLLGTLDPALAAAATVRRVEAGEVLWCAPEVLRLRAEQALATPGREAAAESLLWRASEMARSQGALAWELRCASSLARCWARSGRRSQAASLLGAVAARFSEGFGTADWLAAKALLQDLQR